MMRDINGLYWLHFVDSSGVELLFIHRQEGGGKKGTEVRMRLLLYQQAGFQFTLQVNNKMYMTRFNLRPFRFAFPKCACSPQPRPCNPSPPVLTG